MHGFFLAAFTRRGGIPTTYTEGKEEKAQASCVHGIGSRFRKKSDRSNVASSDKEGGPRGAQLEFFVWQPRGHQGVWFIRRSNWTRHGSCRLCKFPAPPPPGREVTSHMYAQKSKIERPNALGRRAALLRPINSIRRVSLRGAGADVRRPSNAIRNHQLPLQSCLCETVICIFLIPDFAGGTRSPGSSTWVSMPSSAGVKNRRTTRPGHMAVSPTPPPAGLSDRLRVPRADGKIPEI
jgi:hypothetical protein